MSRVAAALVMSPGHREVVDRIARSRTAPHREVERARAWRASFEADGLAGWGRIAKGRGRKVSIPQAKIDAFVDLTLHDVPEGHTHWSCRVMAEYVGVSPATVQRIWDARGLKPHRVDTFKLSNDPQFEAKLIDVVGLYLNPPDKAVVLCMDEKSQIQALDRTQPSLPMVKGRAGTMTHDYKRNGTTTLFAALDVATGKVFGQCLPRHRHEEFLTFLRAVDRNVPKPLAIHIWTTTQPTRTRTSPPGWPSTPASTFTSPRPRQAGSTSSNASSANSPTRTSAAAHSPASPTSSPQSRPTYASTTSTPNPSSGPPPPNPSSPRSNADASPSTN